jgi:hypothetical protein
VEKALAFIGAVICWLSSHLAWHGWGVRGSHGSGTQPTSGGMFIVEHKSHSHFPYHTASEPVPPVVTAGAASAGRSSSCLSL